MSYKRVSHKKFFFVAACVLLAILGADISFAQESRITITINGKNPGDYYSTEPYVHLLKKEGNGDKAAGKRARIGHDGAVRIDLSGEGQWVLSIYPPGGLTPIYSPHLKTGIQSWDIKAAEVSLKGRAAGLEGSEVFLFQKKGDAFSNLWKKSKVTDGRFILPLPDSGGEFYAGIKNDTSITYSDALKAGKQVWEMGKNRPPVIQSFNEVAVEEGGRLLVQLTASDIDGDPVKLGIEKQPGFTVFRDWGDNTGALVIRPRDRAAGTHRMRVVASDGRDSSGKELVLTVKKQEHARQEWTPVRKVPLPDDAALLPGSQLTAIWANEGGDKVTRDELRSSSGKDVSNSAWDGRAIRLFGARNEVVSFNLILEAARKQAGDVSVEFNRLEGPGKAFIESKDRGSKGVFNYNGRNIELFLVRYLQIKGVSRMGYDPTYDERHVPRRLQLPYTMPKGTSRGLFTQRPDAYKYYPDIAVPLEAVEDFDIAQGENQGIWSDIYIPKGAPAGVYRGTVKIFEAGKKTIDVPVSLEVMPFSLPDAPSARTMLYYSEEDINDRYLGKKWPDPSKESQQKAKERAEIWEAHHLVAHRHRISLIDDGTAPPEKMQRWMPVLNGSLFTAKNGYDGPGEGVSSGVYSIGTYGAWRHMWDPESEEAMRLNSDKWVRFFEEKLPQVEYFIFLRDEPKEKDFPLIEKWSSWIKNNTGPGRRLKSLVTTDIIRAERSIPSLDISFVRWGDAAVWKPFVEDYLRRGKSYWSYITGRISNGSFLIEDEGVAPRVVGWTHFKHKVGRWFYWESTHYKNTSHVNHETDVFESAWTFGRRNDEIHPKYGETGQSYSNGDGVLFYPGTDRRYPENSYGLNGPMASLRMKLWRRGIQDVDYLTMASKVDAAAVERIVNRIIPKVLWEVGVTDHKDPTYVHTDIGWPIDPDRWEEARRALAEIIMRGNRDAR